MRRDRNANGPVGVARRRYCNQGHGKRNGTATRRPDFSIDLAEKEGIDIEIKVVGEYSADTEAGELDCPARLLGGVAEQLLDQQHAHYCH